MPIFKNALNNITTQRGVVGANMSRVGFATNVLLASSENFLSAESRIRDTDVAEESANLVRRQILQQAGAAVLGQANQQPSLALKLLAV
jgi:flagellin